jgi:hypothetical protein
MRYTRGCAQPVAAQLACVRRAAAAHDACRAVPAQMDEVTEQLSTNNMKLKGLVTKVPNARSGLPALPGASACRA